MIELKNIEKIYNKNVVLENINVNFMPGHIYGLIGRNGSGKSVLFVDYRNQIKVLFYTMELIYIKTIHFCQMLGHLLMDRVLLII